MEILKVRPDSLVPTRASSLAAKGGHPSRLAWAFSNVACLVWLLAFALLVRGFGFIPTVLDPDESLYLLQAREWLRGGWPYVAVWDMHPVGAPAIIAAGFLVFGESIASARLVGAIAVALTGYLLFRIVVQARCGRAAGLAAGVLYVAHTVLPGGLATNTELLFAPFVTGGFMVAIGMARAVLEEGRRPSVAGIASMGLCFGAALLVKQVAAPEACAAFAAIMALAVWRIGMPFRGFLARAAAFAAGCAAPMAATAAVYWLRGDLSVFLDANFVAPMLYVAKHTETAGFVMLRMVLSSVVERVWLLLAAAAALGTLRRHRRFDLHGALIVAALLWFVGATAGIVLPGKFFAHYFLMWLPPLCLAAAIGLREIVIRMGPRRPGIALLAVVAVIASMPVLGDLAGLGRRGVGLRLPDPPQVVANVVAGLVPPGETAFVVNYEPVVYFLADLPLPTRIPLWQQLAGGYGEAIGQESDAELARVLASKPYLLVISQPHWRDVRPNVQRAIEAALEEGYEEAQSVQGTLGMVELWRRR